MYVTYSDLFTFVLMIVAIITLVKIFYDKQEQSGQAHINSLSPHS